MISVFYNCWRQLIIVINITGYAYVAFLLRFLKFIVKIYTMIDHRKQSTRSIGDSPEKIVECAKLKIWI